MTSAPNRKHGQLTPGEASDVGLDADQLNVAADLLSGHVDAGDFSAASLFIARKGRSILSRGFGTLRPEAGSPAVDADSIFLLASITKPVTACALMQLVDKGLISLDDPVQQHLPEFTGWDKGQIRVRQILSHISGMPDMLPQNTELRRAHRPMSAFVQGALHTNLLYSPGTDFSYQSKGILLAAEIVERITGQRLRNVEKAGIFQPLGMNRSCLGIDDFDISDTVWVGTSMDESPDAQHWGPNSAYWRDFGCPWGGMHSTGPDLGALLQCLLNGGLYGDQRVLSQAAARAMVSNQNPAHLDAPWGVGWALRDSNVWAFFGEQVSSRTFGHVGATGTVAWADPESELICVCLTNVKIQGGSLLRRVSNAVAAAVID
jgi:CubicO group peptidase (beta-lactamase class C family)